MTEWAAAAHRGRPGSTGTGTVGCGLAGPLGGPAPGNLGMPSASAWCVPVGVLRLRARAPLSKRPGSPSLGFQSFHGPDFELQQDIRTINIRLIYIYRYAACGQFRVCPHAQTQLALFPGKRPTLGPARQRNPQHFHCACTGSAVLRTSHPHLCAQPAGKQPSCRTGRQQPISTPVLVVTQPADSGPGADEIVHEAGRGCSPPPWLWAPAMVASAPAVSGCCAAAR
jgi:hypothetical protein